MSKQETLIACMTQALLNLKTGNSNLDDNQCMELIDVINKVTSVENKYSKYQSCKYLGLSRSTFDRYVKDGIIRDGRKESGFKEKFWYKKDLDDAKYKILNMRNNNCVNN